MKVLILGGDGYLGWPTAMAFAARGHEVSVIDNYFRRRIAIETRSEALLPNPCLIERTEIFHSLTGFKVRSEIGDCTDYRTLSRVFRDARPDAVVHYAEQPSAPYSMINHECASRTLNNNLNSTLNLIWAVLEHAPECHIIKLGTMGEYGTPNIDIEEGWIDIEHNGRKDRFLYPRQAGSLYHTTKVLDTDLLYFYTRIYGIRVTDLMQGPVYGIATPESELGDRLMPNFHYDDIFGTVVNRFLVQAAAGVPLTVYGKGGQTRGYINLNDTIQCVELSMLNPPKKGELRIFNQFTEKFTVNELASKVKEAGRRLGLKVNVTRIENPRQEKEEHYYNVRHDGLFKLRLKPNYMTEELLAGILEKIIKHRTRIDERKLMPRVRWKAA
ncbi:MAG TPA: NAD-dependent dehydratase [Deltaproteobacteria bacterium]|nr:MAG: NAD-dependent dehydratase [Deltaproteobacteria bacterium GWA2_55_82]OGQ63486.1 MAG: NAD-dependent dehydratase [Deltaproteobacteria bacterium RIFCSPLOWO2_02_FULL_55_12]OIJ75173.1 MAG: NAD-dependent dehydratase [Deltaproteobacteria bacterium GWC2_55_46]HBG47483.1 NAD-dependent dehydratase [Deltaproteobacteria bacterium]HCY11499.1 NAD-dependent dehydratase [Deltaproteobacteria bacterium]